MKPAKPRKPISGKKIYRSTATYAQTDGSQICDLEELADNYQYVVRIPERIGLLKAYEIALLAEAFLVLYRKKGKRR
jgi:hypothetical protein